MFLIFFIKLTMSTIVIFSPTTIIITVYNISILTIYMHVTCIYSALYRDPEKTILLYIYSHIHIHIYISECI